MQGARRVREAHVTDDAIKIKNEAALARGEIDRVRERYRENEAALGRAKNRYNRVRQHLAYTYPGGEWERIWAKLKPKMSVPIERLVNEKRELEADLTRLKRFRDLDLVGESSTEAMQRVARACRDDERWATAEAVTATRRLIVESLEKALERGGGTP